MLFRFVFFRSGKLIFLVYWIFGLTVFIGLEKIRAKVTIGHSNNSRKFEATHEMGIVNDYFSLNLIQNIVYKNYTAITHLKPVEAS